MVETRARRPHRRDEDDDIFLADGSPPSVRPGASISRAPFVRCQMNVPDKAADMPAHPRTASEPRFVKLRTAFAEARGLLAFSAFVLACLWSGIGLQIHREQEQAMQAARINLANLARAFAEHTAKSIEGADQAIRFIRNEYLGHPQDLDVAGYLRDKQIIGDDYHLISVIGSDGMVSFSSRPFERVDLSDREHFKVHAQGSVDSLFVSKPVRGRVSHKLSIQLTRRVDRPDGRFGGVVVLSLSPEYLTTFYRDVNLGPQGAITLVGFDGVVRARASRDGTEGAQSVAGSPLFQQALQQRRGTAVATSSIDHVQRVWAYRTLDDYKLIVMTGMGMDDLLADAVRNERAYLVVGALLSFIILGFTGGLVRKRMHQLALVRALEVSNEMANAANAMKSRLLASVSHELRTPLNGMLGYAELVRDFSVDDDTRQYGQIIHQSAEHLLGLVNTILDLAKIESGRMVARPAHIPVASLLEEVRLLSAGHAQSKCLELQVRLSPDTPASITSDRMRVLQILNNLVNNAIKFSSAGAVTISTHVDGAFLVIEVVDQGRGMTTRQVEAAFDRFQPEGVDSVHDGQGAGLGLPLSKDLAELLGGSIDILSQPGVGTCVVVRLPIDWPSSTREPKPCMNHEPPSSSMTTPSTASSCPSS